MDRDGRLIGLFGKGHFHEFLQREITHTKDPEQQRQLREIAGKF